MSFPCRILLVEHDPDQRTLLSNFLRKQPGLELLSPLASGAEALSRIRADRPDLVLLDAVTVDLDSLSILETLEMGGILSTLPVILLAPHQDARLANAALALGACYVLTKPFDLDCLLRRIQAFSENGSPLEIRLRWLGLQQAGIRFRQLQLAAEAMYSLRDSQPQMKVIYVQVARQENTTPGNVAKNVERAIKTAHEKGTSYYHILFGHPQNAPSSKRFLLRLIKDLSDPAH